MAPLVETAPEDYDLQRGWSDVLQAFAKAAKIELRLDRVLSPEDVIAQLKSKRDKDEADSLSYLVTAGQNYSSIFSSLEGLLKQVSGVVERMVVYLKMKEVDRPLRKIVHELLQNIISICALSIKVLHGNKILKFLKVFAFNEDDGVKGALEDLKALVDRESQMKTTLIYAIVKEGLSDANEAVSGVRSVVDRLADESKERESDNADRKQMEKIRVTLGVQKDIDQQTAVHSRLWSETVHETGQWLPDEKSYQQWADRTTDFNKVMFLSADAGFGKTFMVTSAIHSLQKRYIRQLDDSARTMIAYYHLLPKESKSTHGHRTDSSIEIRQEDCYDYELSRYDIFGISEWAAGLLGADTEKDYEWNRCAARLLRLYKEIDEAINYYKKAIILTDEHWYAEYGLASAYGDNEKAQDTINLGEDLKNRLKEGLPQVEQPELTMVELRNNLAIWYRDVKRYDEALGIFDEGLAANADRYYLWNEKLNVFHAMGSYQRIFDCLRSYPISEMQL